MSFNLFSAFVSQHQTHIQNGLERTKPAERAQVSALVSRFVSGDSSPLSPLEAGIALAMWNTPHLIQWISQRGLHVALESVLSAINYTNQMFEWDSSVWVLRTAKAELGLSNLDESVWTFLREGIKNCSKVEYENVNAVAASARKKPYIVRAALAYLLPNETHFWTQDDDAKLRHVDVDNWTLARFAFMAALRKHELPKRRNWGVLDVSADHVNELLEKEAVASLRIQRAFETLAKRGDVDSLRVLGEFSDGCSEFRGEVQISKNAWRCLESVGASKTSVIALASLFCEHRPQRTLGLHIARALVGQWIVEKKEEAEVWAKDNTSESRFIESVLNLSGVRLPANTQWNSDWASNPQVKKSKKPAPVVIPSTAQVAEKIHWKPGQQNELAGSFEERNAKRDKETVPDIRRNPFLFRLGHLTDELALSVFESIPAVKWYGQAEDLLSLLARFEFDALPQVLSHLKTKPNEIAALSQVESPKVAPLMAHALGKKSKHVAIAWFESFPNAAVLGLISELSSTEKARRVAAEKALAHIRENGLAKELLTKIEAQNKNVSFEPEPFQLPAKPPKLPPFLKPEFLPRPVARDGTAALDVAQLTALLAALKATLPGNRTYADSVATKFTEQSLSAMAAALFQQWLFADAPPKEKWALYVSGVFPNEDAASAIGRLAKTWAPQQRSARAQEAVEMLAMMRTPAALTEIYDLSRKVQSKALKARAEAVFAAEAKRMKLSPEDLADRIIPEVPVFDQLGGFDVVFDAKLKPFLVNKNGAPVDESDVRDVSDEEWAQFTELKKLAPAVGRAQSKRLELSMAEGRRMSLEQFTEVYVMHSLVRRLTRKLVWGAWMNEQCVAMFSLGSAGLVTIDGSPFSPPAQAVYGLVHAIELTSAQHAKWKAQLGEQPFEQLDRKTFSQSDSGGSLMHEAEQTVPTTQLLGLGSRGWVRGDSEQGGCYFSMTRKLSSWVASINFYPGIYLGAPTQEPVQTIRGIEVDSANALPPRIYSELQRDLQYLLAR
jgi:hypothetical protein